MLFCFSFSKMCLCVWFSKTGIVNREEPKTTSWLISTVMLFLCEVANLKKNDKKLRIVLCTLMYSYFFKYKFKPFDLSMWYRDSTEIEFRWVSPPCLSRVAENITQWYTFNMYLSVCVSTNQLHKSVFLFHCHFGLFMLITLWYK